MLWDWSEPRWQVVLLGIHAGRVGDGGRTGLWLEWEQLVEVLLDDGLCLVLTCL